MAHDNSLNEMIQKEKERMHSLPTPKEVRRIVDDLVDQEVKSAAGNVHQLICSAIASEYHNMRNNTLVVTVPIAVGYVCLDLSKVPSLTAFKKDELAKILGRHVFDHTDIGKAKDYVRNRFPYDARDKFDSLWFMKCIINKDIGGNEDYNYFWGYRKGELFPVFNSILTDLCAKDGVSICGYYYNITKGYREKRRKLRTGHIGPLFWEDHYRVVLGRNNEYSSLKIKVKYRG